MVIVDSHCHLDCLDFSLDDLPSSLDEALNKARSNNVHYFLCVSITLENFPDVLALSKKYKEIYASCGVHPTEQDGEEPSHEKLISLAQDEKVIAIGETGLDYHWCKDKPEWQRNRFRLHISVANELNKPLIIHSRTAKEDTLRIMQEEGADKCRGVMHCFTEDYDMAKRAVDLGFYVSFSGILTFKNATTIQDAAKRLPLDRILIETDCPYLAPTPYRGKTNQPAFVRYVAEFMANLRGESLERIAEQTTLNFQDLFGIKLEASA